MFHIMQFLFFLSLACTVASLIIGLATYFKGGTAYARYGNACMRWRVTFQTLTLILFFLILWMKY